MNHFVLFIHGRDVPERECIFVVLSTKVAAGDNDPVDVMELSGTVYSIGDVVPCILLGVLELIDQGELDYKILTLAADHPLAVTAGGTRISHCVCLFVSLPPHACCACLRADAWLLTACCLLLVIPTGSVNDIADLVKVQPHVVELLVDWLINYKTTDGTSRSHTAIQPHCTPYQSAYSIPHHAVCLPACLPARLPACVRA